MPDSLVTDALMKAARKAFCRRAYTGGPPPHDCDGSCRECVDDLDDSSALECALTAVAPLMRAAIEAEIRKDEREKCVNVIMGFGEGPGVIRAIVAAIRAMKEK